jgi:hypothetical protein
MPTAGRHASLGMARAAVQVAGERFATIAKSQPAATAAAATLASRTLSRPARPGAPGHQGARRPPGRSGPVPGASGRSARHRDRRPTRPRPPPDDRVRAPDELTGVVVGDGLFAAPVDLDVGGVEVQRRAHTRQRGSGSSSSSSRGSSTRGRSRGHGGRRCSPDLGPADDLVERERQVSLPRRHEPARRRGDGQAPPPQLIDGSAPRDPRVGRPETSM